MLTTLLFSALIPQFAPARILSVDSREGVDFVGTKWKPLYERVMHVSDNTALRWILRARVQCTCGDAEDIEVGLDGKSMEHTTAYPIMCSGVDVEMRGAPVAAGDHVLTVMTSSSGSCSTAWAVTTQTWTGESP